MSLHWRVRYAPNTPGEKHPTQIRISLGEEHRDFSIEDARSISDRIHDLADTIETHQEGTTP